MGGVIQDRNGVAAAFARLAAGDDATVARMLSPSVAWRAVAARGLAGPVDFGQRGAGLYLRSMANAIRSGRYTLQLIGVEAVPGSRTDFTVRSRWVTAAGAQAQMCSQRVSYQNGMIIAVTEGISAGNAPAGFAAAQR